MRRSIFSVLAISASAAADAITMRPQFKNLCQNGRISKNSNTEDLVIFLGSYGITNRVTWRTEGHKLVDMGAFLTVTDAKKCIYKCQFSWFSKVPCSDCLRFIECRIKKKIVRPSKYIETSEPKCGISKSKRIVSKVIGGSTTHPGKYPWQVSLRNSKGRNACGGTLLNRQWVLTAAHCVTTNSGSKKPAVDMGGYNYIAAGFYKNHQNAESLGSEFVKKGADFVKVDKAVVHEGWTFQGATHDIALLRLERNLVYPENEPWPFIRPICIPSESYENRHLKGKKGMCKVTGWGKTEKGRASKDLLDANMDTLTARECIKELAKKDIQSKLIDNQVCGVNTRSSKRIDTCQGDSGGPLQCKSNNQEQAQFCQVGITSYGYGCGLNIPAMYTRVSKYIPWIQEQLKKHSRGKNFGIQIKN